MAAQVYLKGVRHEVQEVAKDGTRFRQGMCDAGTS
jgi:hypothetical protein